MGKKDTSLTLMVTLISSPALMMVHGIALGVLEIGMVFGDPNNFGILIEKISIWSAENGYENGLFHFCIDGELYPPRAKVASLGSDVFYLSDDNALISLPVENEIFSMDKKEAFFSMLRLMLPDLADPEVDVDESFVSSYLYQASTPNLEEDSCYVFAVSNGQDVRILGAKLSELIENEAGEYFWEDKRDIQVKEAIINKSELISIVNQAKNYCSSIS